MHNLPQSWCDYILEKDPHRVTPWEIKKALEEINARLSSLAKAERKLEQLKEELAEASAKRISIHDKQHPDSLAIQLEIEIPHSSLIAARSHHHFFAEHVAEEVYRHIRKYS